MPKREFFARMPLWLRFLPSMAVVALLFIPIVALDLHGPFAPASSDIATSLTVLARELAIIGLAGAALVLALFLITYKKRPPILTIDETNLATPLMKLTWPVVRKVWPQKFLGLSVLCISTTNDNDLIRRLPLLLKIRAKARFLVLKAPIVLPAVRGMQLSELCDLVEEYRHTGRAVQ